MPIAINRAELRFDVQDHSEFPSDSIITTLQPYYSRDTDTSTYKVYSRAINSLTDLTFLDDYYSANVQTTKYNRAKEYYSLDITLHLQNLLKDSFKNNYFYLEPTDFKANYKEGIFRSGNNSKPMKLIITYSNLQ